MIRVGNRERGGYYGSMTGRFHYRPARSQPPHRSARDKTLAEWRRWDWSSEEKAAEASAQSTDAIVKRVLFGLRIDQRQAETEILKVWNNQIDPSITDHAQPTGIRLGTLFVTVDSSVWLDEIVRYRRKEILERLQNSFGRDLIAKISFRVG